MRSSQQQRTRSRRGYIAVPEHFRAEISWRGGIDYVALKQAPESLEW